MSRLGTGSTPAASDTTSFVVRDDLPGVRLHRLDGSRHFFHVYNDAYAVCTALRTASEFVYAGRFYAGRDGGTFLLQPGEVFRQTTCPVPETIRSLHLSAELVHELAADLGLRQADLRFNAVSIDGREVFPVVLGVCASLERPATVLERESRLLDALRLVFERATRRPLLSARSPQEPGAVRRAQELLEAHFAERVALDELARAAGVSKFHLLRCFHRRFGVPPHAYQIRRRLAEAVRLLDQGLSPAAVAAELGFADQSHFTRCYRAVLGATPGAHVRLAR